MIGRKGTKAGLWVISVGGCGTGDKLVDTMAGCGDG